MPAAGTRIGNRTETSARLDVIAHPTLRGSVSKGTHRLLTDRRPSHQSGDRTPNHGSTVRSPRHPTTKIRDALPLPELVHGVSNIREACVTRGCIAREQRGSCCVRLLGASPPATALCLAALGRARCAKRWLARNIPRSRHIRATIACAVLDGKLPRVSDPVPRGRRRGLRVRLRRRCQSGTR